MHEDKSSLNIKSQRSLEVTCSRESGSLIASSNRSCKQLPFLSPSHINHHISNIDRVTLHTPDLDSSSTSNSRMLLDHHQLLISNVPPNTNHPPSDTTRYLANIRDVKASLAPPSTRKQCTPPSRQFSDIDFPKGIARIRT